MRAQFSACVAKHEHHPALGLLEAPPSPLGTQHLAQGRRGSAVATAGNGDYSRRRTRPLRIEGLRRARRGRARWRAEGHLLHSAPERRHERAPARVHNHATRRRHARHSTQAHRAPFGTRHGTIVSVCARSRGGRWCAAAHLRYLCCIIPARANSLAAVSGRGPSTSSRGGRDSHSALALVRVSGVGIAIDGRGIGHCCAFVRPGRAHLLHISAVARCHGVHRPIIC